MHFKLNVPYKEKDQAKKFGARWNFQEKYWYYEGEELPDGLVRWYEDVEKVCEDIAALDGTSQTDLFAGYQTVSQVNEMISQKYYETKEFQLIMVKGEITNYSGHRGMHYYFALKDKQSVLPCMMWEDTARQALKFNLEKGQQVAVVGNLEYYRQGGKSQLIVKRIVNIGDGEANLAFLQLKEKLQKEGLFDLEHKKPIPKHPKTVGIITSKDGQAIRDICKVAGKRNPYVQLLLYHVKVQGKDAVSTIVEGIRIMDKLDLDTIIVGRGGGSDEELKAYNEEVIARAVYEARTPIISAVGHEGHWTLIDYTADKRVATPSEAAEEAVPDIMTVVRRIEQLQDEIKRNMNNKVEQRKLLLDIQMATLEKYNPERILKEQKNRLETELMQLNQNMRNIFNQRMHRYEILLANLNGLSPTAKLIKGFGYISLQDKPVTTVKDVTVGDALTITIHDGSMNVEVKEIADKLDGE